jgi:hypothetical protein
MAFPACSRSLDSGLGSGSPAYSPREEIPLHSFSTAVVSSNEKVVFFASSHDAVNAIVKSEVQRSLARRLIAGLGRQPACSRPPGIVITVLR